MQALLTTKLRPPALPPKYLKRPQIVQQLNTSLAARQRVILVSAPAGFGKTTLLCDWVAGLDQPVAWIALDVMDNDFAFFYSYLVAAIQTIHPRIGQSTMALLQSSAQPPIQTILSPLLNDMSTMSEPLVIVLDDYHLITSQSIQNGMQFLLTHQPQQLQWVIATRADPTLQLAQIRGRGQLFELRLPDLRFSAVEVDDYLQSIEVSLSSTTLSDLNIKLDGWILGLQLFGLASRGRTDIDEFAKTFDGEHRYVIDYLAEAVFDGLGTDEIRFLTETSILDEFNSALCDAVRQRDDGDDMLQKMVRENMFIFQLDEKRAWFRYHHLFAEFLRAHLQRNSPEIIADLHRRASRWYLIHGYQEQSVQHALAIPDFELASSIVQTIASDVYARGGWYTLHQWLVSFPEVVIEAHPVLAIWYALTLMMHSNFQDAERYIQEAAPLLDKWLQKDKINAKDYQAYSILVNTSLAEIFQQRGDMENAFQYAQSAQAQLPRYRHTMHTVVARRLSDCYLHQNDTQKAISVLDQVIETQQAADNLYLSLGVLGQAARLKELRGQYTEALRLYRQGLNLAKEHDLEFLGSELLIGLGAILGEKNELLEAEKLIQNGVEYARSGQRVSIICRGLLTLSRVRRATNDIQGAKEALNQAQDYAEQSNRSRYLYHVRAHQARFATQIGDLATANHWRQTCGLQTDEDCTIMNEEYLLILVRVLLALGNKNQADALCENLRAYIKAGQRNGRLIEVYILQSLYCQADGNCSQASNYLRKAVHLAEYQGNQRVFLDEGQPMIELLQSINQEKNAPKYVQTLLKSARQDGVLIENLSETEKRILKLIADGLSNQGIAAGMHLSLNTVIWHNKNIFRKLGVKRRTQAVARARQLGLIQS